MGDYWGVMKNHNYVKKSYFQTILGVGFLGTGETLLSQNLARM